MCIIILSYERQRKYHQINLLTHMHTYPENLVGPVYSEIIGLQGDCYKEEKQESNTSKTCSPSSCLCRGPAKQVCEIMR